MEEIMLKYKKQTVYLLLLIAFSAVFVSAAAARDTADSISDVGDGGLIAPAPEDGLIAPAPDENATTDGGEQTYRILDNQTSTEDNGVLAPEDGNVLIASNPSNDNNLALIALIVVAVVGIIGAMGVFAVKRMSAKN